MASYTTIQSVILLLLVVDNSQRKKVILFLFVCFEGHGAYTLSFLLFYPLFRSPEYSTTQPWEVQDIAVAFTNKYLLRVASFGQDLVKVSIHPRKKQLPKAPQRQ